LKLIHEPDGLKSLFEKKDKVSK